jgi:hypothetical protein
MNPEHLLERRCAPFRPHLLERPDGGVEQDYHEDEACIRNIGKEDGDDPRRKEHIDERAHELAKEDLQHRRGPLLREGILPKDPPPTGNLCIRKTPCRGFEPFGYLECRKSVPCRRAGFVRG